MLLFSSREAHCEADDDCVGFSYTGDERSPQDGTPKCYFFEEFPSGGESACGTVGDNADQFKGYDTWHFFLKGEEGKFGKHILPD